MQSNSKGSTLGSIEKPFYDLMDLNTRTLQNLSYVSPMSFLTESDPAKFWEMNADALRHNSHSMLDYFHDVYAIWEKYWLNVSCNVLDQNHQIISQTSKTQLEDFVKKVNKNETKRHSTKAA